MSNFNYEYINLILSHNIIKIPIIINIVSLNSFPLQINKAISQ